MENMKNLNLSDWKENWQKGRKSRKKIFIHGSGLVTTLCTKIKKILLQDVAMTSMPEKISAANIHRNLLKVEVYFKEFNFEYAYERQTYQVFTSKRIVKPTLRVHCDSV